MNLLNWSDPDRAALRNFYEADGSWSWEDLENGRGAICRAVRDWIEASAPPRANPLLLPRVQGTDSATRSIWYAVAFSETQAEALREDLTAFAGPAGTDFTGLRADLVAADVAESCLALWAGGPWIFRLSVLPSCRDIVRGALERLRRSWRLRPSFAGTTFRTTEALLREFSSALVNADEVGALHWWGELRTGGRLSAENLVFLEIERLAAFGRWQDLAALPQLSLLMPGRRPHRITILIVEALWRTELACFAQGNDASGAIQYFRSQFGPRYHGVLRARGNSTGAPVALTFLLAAVASEPPRREQIPVLLGLLTDPVDKAFAQALTELVPGIVHASPVAEAKTPSLWELGREACEHQDYDTAWLYLEKVTPATVESWSRMLECADELQSAEAAEVVSSRFHALTPEQQIQGLSTHRQRRAWEAVQKLLAPNGVAIPANWEEWLDCLDTTPEWPRLLPLAREADTEWPISAYLQDPERVKRLALRIVENRTGPAKETLRFAFPSLLGFFLLTSQSQAVFLPFYFDLLFLLGESESFSTEDWATSQTLLQAILEAGAGRNLYADALVLVTDIWQKFGNSTRLEWALDTLDMLLAANAPDSGARAQFFDSVRDSFSKDYRRVDNEQWSVLEWLAFDLDRAEEIKALRPAINPASKTDKSGITNLLAGKVVGIYTLTESAGARAKSIVETLFPDATVRLNHEVDGSNRLKSLAREADFFIVATQRATHAVTDFLKAQRPRGKSAFIYPTGKGSSSIVAALKKALEAEQVD